MPEVWEGDGGGFTGGGDGRCRCQAVPWFSGRSRRGVPRREPARRPGKRVPVYQVRIGGRAEDFG